MSTAEKVVIILCVFGGFLWLRARARSVNPERSKGMVLIGIFLVLPALLVAEKQLFERLPYGPWTNLLLKALILLGTFAAVGYGFLRQAEEARTEEDGTPSPEDRMSRPKDGA